MRELLTQTVTITRREPGAQTDAYGDPVDVSTSSTVPGALQQLVRTEPAASGEFSSTDWRLFLPSDATLDTSDTVTVDGVAYEVQGDPWAVQDHELGRVSHVEATLRKAG